MAAEPSVELLSTIRISQSSAGKSCARRLSTHVRMNDAALKNGTITENVGRKRLSFSLVAAGLARPARRLRYTCQPMAKQHTQHPMRIQLSEDRRASLLRSIKEHVAEHFDEPLADFRAQALLDFFVRELGPPVYKQACATPRATSRASLRTSTRHLRTGAEPVVTLPKRSVLGLPPAHRHFTIQHAISGVTCG
jgi:uncharacterized protein (DUF2164 family)